MIFKTLMRGVYLYGTMILKMILKRGGIPLWNDDFGTWNVFHINPERYSETIRPERGSHNIFFVYNIFFRPHIIMLKKLYTLFILQKYLSNYMAQVHA